MKARISLLHKTEAEWAKVSFTPAYGEIVVYDPDDKHKYARLKIGDNKTPVQELDFIIDSATKKLLEAQQLSEVIDAGNILDYLN
jgi:hypothetical protein